MNKFLPLFDQPRGKMASTSSCHSSQTKKKMEMFAANLGCPLFPLNHCLSRPPVTACLVTNSGCPLFPLNLLLCRWVVVYIERRKLCCCLFCEPFLSFSKAEGSGVPCESFLCFLDTGPSEKNTCWLVSYRHIPV